MTVNIGKNHNFSIFTLTFVLLAAISITFGTVISSANSNEVLHTQHRKTPVSQLPFVTETKNYLQAVKASSVLSADFNRFNNGQTKFWKNDFKTFGEIEIGRASCRESVCCKV